MIVVPMFFSVHSKPEALNLRVVSIFFSIPSFPANQRPEQRSAEGGLGWDFVEVAH